MKQERLQQLITFYREDPTDPFNAYALAMEYLNEDLIEAKKYLEELLENHPNYLPTYSHAAAVYIDLGNREKAEMTYEKGIELAKKQQNNKAIQELQRAYQMFLDDED